MLDPSCKSFTFEEISEELPHENVHPKNEFLKRLLSDFWRDKFDHRNLGWNEPRARLFLGLQDLYNVDESSPCPSRSVSEKDDCARPRDFRLMSREIAFDLLLAVEDPLAFSFGDESDPDFYDLLYDFLAKNGLRPLDPGGQAVLENIALTKDELCRWCQRCGEKLPQSFEQAPPQKRQQATPEAQTTQESEPLEKTAPQTTGRRQQRSHETEQKYERWYGRSQDIKDPEKPRRPIEIARIIAKQEIKAGNTKANAETIKRRLNRDFPGWAG